MLDILRSHDSAPDSAMALLGESGYGCSYAQLVETISRNMANLKPLGDNHRLLLSLPDDPTTALAIAAVCLEGTAIPANPNLTLVELEKLASDSGAVTIITRDEPDNTAKILAAQMGLGLVLLDPHGNAHFADFDFTLSTPPNIRTDKTDHNNFAIILPTSGSTGTPKLVPHTLESLLISAKSIAETLQLGPDDTCIHALPMFHIGAVVDLFLAPLLSGGRIRFSHSVSPKTMAENIIEAQATWFQGVPTMLYAIINAMDPDDLLEVGRSLRFIRSVSADLTAARQSEIEKSFGAVPVIQMYGMTETAGQICSNPLPPLTRKTGTVGIPQAPEIIILDQFGNPVPDGSVGEVCVCGPSVMKGYLAIDDKRHFFGKWLRTGDLGQLDRDGYLSLKGRIKDMINRGGEKIPALEIEQAALQISGVIEAASVAIYHPTLGEDVGLAIVASSEDNFTAEMVQENMSAHLAAFKIPRTILFKSALPKLGSGKLDKKALASEFNNKSKSVANTETVSPIGSMIADIWVKSLKAPYPKTDDDFFDAGGDSLSAQTFMIELEEAFGQALPSNLLYEAPSFGELEEKLTSLEKTQEIPQGSNLLPDEVMKMARRGMAGWRGARRDAHALIVELRNIGEKQPFFFCTPTESSFTDFHAALDTDRPFYAMRTLWLQDGRSDEAEGLLAKHYAMEICEIQPEGDILLGGHCRGVEMIRKIGDALTEAGRKIALLVEIDFPIDALYQGPAIQIWSNDHPLSWKFSHPLSWNKYHYTHHVIHEHFNVPHSQITRGATATKIANFIDPLMDKATEGDGSHHPAVNATSQEIETLLEQRHQLHSADIRLKTPKLATRDENITIHASVKNTSQQIWKPSKESGLRLLARWQRPNKSLLRSLAGTCDLETSVYPGETIKLTFTVKFHRHTTPLFLYVDMVDEGICWFHETQGSPARKLIVPRYWKRGKDTMEKNQKTDHHGVETID